MFGGRGAPYHLGSRIRPEYDRVPRVFAALEQTVHELFPAVRGHAVTHRWGGPLGIARDWHASVGLDRATGLAWAGGYVGDGVSTANLAGRTLADLITGRDTTLAGLPWVGHRSRRWEPEPLRWVGANLGLAAMTWADRAELRTGPAVANRLDRQRHDRTMTEPAVPSTAPTRARHKVRGRARRARRAAGLASRSGTWRSSPTGTRSCCPPRSRGDGDRVLLHGSTGSRWMRPLADGAPASRRRDRPRRAGRGPLGVRVLDALPQRGAVRPLHAA